MKNSDQTPHYLILPSFNETLEVKEVKEAEEQLEQIEAMILDINQQLLDRIELKEKFKLSDNLAQVSIWVRKAHSSRRHLMQKRCRLLSWLKKQPNSFYYRERSIEEELSTFEFRIQNRTDEIDRILKELNKVSECND